jgi:hypothetical protein
VVVGRRREGRLAEVVISKGAFNTPDGGAIHCKQ